MQTCFFLLSKFDIQFNKHKGPDTLMTTGYGCHNRHVASNDPPHSLCYYPCFRDHHQRMSSMMRGFHDPFSHFGFPAALPGVENGGWAGRSNRGSQQLARPTDMFGSMFGDMFTNMNSMMANMHRNFVSLTSKLCSLLTYDYTKL